MKRLLAIGCAVLVASVLAFGGAPKVVPDATYHLAVLSEPSALTCESGQRDCTVKLPKSKRSLPSGVPFYVEVWVGRPQAPGISCAYVDLVSHMSGGGIGIEYGDAFDVFQSGTFKRPGSRYGGSVTDLGACTLEPGGVGIWPEWVLVARVELQARYKGKASFELTDPTHEALGTSVYGQGFAVDVEYDECQVNVRARKYNKRGVIQ